jgi:pyruvyl transferase EpsO
MSAVAGFCTIILLVRHMEVHAYAGYIAMLGMTTVAGMLAGLGMERALMRFIPEGHMHHPAPALAGFIWITSLLRLAVMAAIIGTLYLLWPQFTAHFSGLSISADFPPALAFLVLNTAMFQLLSAVMQALVQQKTLTRVLVVQWGGRLAIIFAMVTIYADISLTQAIWLMAIPDGVGVLILVLVIHRYLTRLAAVQHGSQMQAAAWPSWPQVRRLSLDNYGYNLVAALPQGSSMIILAAALLAAPFVAAYGFYVNLIDRLKQYLPLQFMLNLAEPVLIAGYVKDKDFGRLWRHNQLLYKSNLMLLMPGLAWIAAIAPQMTSVLTGGKYAEYAWVLPILILQLALGSHATIIQIIINAVGKSEILSLSGCSALLAMAAAIGAVMVGGHYEYLIVTPLVYEIVNNAVAMWGLRQRGFRYDAQWSFHGKLVVITTIAYGCAGLASGLIAALIPQILIAGFVSVTVFIFLSAFMRMFDREEFQTLKSMLRRHR